MKTIIIFLLTALIISNADSSKNIKDSFKRKVSLRMMESTSDSTDTKESNSNSSSSVEPSYTNSEENSEKQDGSDTNSDLNNDSSSVEQSNANIESSSEKSDGSDTNSDLNNDSSSVEPSNTNNETNDDGTNTNEIETNTSNIGLSENISNTFNETTENVGTDDTNAESTTEEDNNTTNTIDESSDNATEEDNSTTNKTDESSDISTEEDNNTTNTIDESSDNATEEDSNTSNTSNGSSDKSTEEDTNTTNQIDKNNTTEISDEDNNTINGSDITDSSDYTSEVPPDEQPTEKPISIDEANKKADIKLSFRQIQGFNFNKETHSITFTFFGIAAQPIQTGYSFTFRIYLLFIDGTKDTELSEATCTYEKDQFSDGLQTQTEFNCIIKDLDENQEYSSFEIFDSEYIAGIPDDKTLLDPVKTQQAIDDKLLDDYSLEENQHKYPLFFRTEILDGSVSETGDFIIIGTISDQVKEDIYFNLDLTYPANQVIECKLPSSPSGRVEIECVFKNSISDYIVIELQIIKQGLKELFTMAALKSSAPYHWKNQTDSSQEIQTNIAHSTDILTDKPIPVEIEKKLNLYLSFRQVYGFYFNPSAHFITFNFFGITTQKIVNGYEFYFELYLILEDGTKDTELTKALCSLDKDVDPTNKQAQADFNCSISNLNENQKYLSFEIYGSEEIAGIPEDKTLLDPIKTEQAIKDGKLLDYSLDENKEKLPIFFQTESIVGNYNEKGEFKILGSVEEKIETDMEFTIELIYPENHMASCKLLKSDPGQVEIVCTMEKIFYGEFVMIEQQILQCELLEITVTSLKSSEKLDWIKDAEEDTGEISSQIPDKDKNGTNESDKEISTSDETKESDKEGVTSDETKESDKEGVISDEAKESDKEGVTSDETKESDKEVTPSDETKETDKEGVTSDETKESDKEATPSDETKESDKEATPSDETKESDKEGVTSDETKESDKEATPSDETKETNKN